MEKEKQRLPLLLRSHGRHSEKQSIYNLLEDRYYTLCLSVLCNKSVLCSAYGWLVLLDRTGDSDEEGDCCIWNPTSMEIIELPHFDDPHPYNSCVLSKSPTDPDCFIVFRTVSSWDLDVFRIGDHTLFRENSDEEGSIVAMVSFKGVIYGITQYCSELEYEFVTVDMDGAKLKARPLLIDGERPWRIPEPSRSWVIWTLIYLIESPCGNELILVTQLLTDTYLKSSGVHFRVFRVDVGRMECEELKNLDDRTIFLSYYGNGFCRFSKSFGATIKPNSIYYTNETGMVVYVYDMDDRSTTMLLPCPDADIDPDTSENYWVDLPDNIHKYLGVDNFVHVDMHPGNILVRVAQNKPSRKKLFKTKPHVVFKIVGMTAELSKNDRINLLEFFKAVARRDGQTAAKCTLRLSKKQNCPKPEEFIQEVKESFDFWGTTEGDVVHPAECMQQLLEQVRRHKVNVDGNVCTVMVTVLVLEGWQRKLDPDYDVMHTLQKVLLKADWAESLSYTIERLMAP